MIPKLPPSGRFSYRIKAAILDCIAAGKLSVEQACHHYAISTDELAQWREKLAVGGVGALKVTLQRPRERPHQCGVNRVGKAA